MSLNGNLSRIHERVGLEIINDAADAPGPGTDRPPLVRRGLRPAGRQGEPDDALRPGPCAIRLNVLIAHRRISPATRENFCSGGRREWRALATAARRVSASEIHHQNQWYGMRRVRRRVNGEGDARA